MIQFDYEVHSYFGNHVKVIIEDNTLRYTEFIIAYGKNGEWVTPDIPEARIADFLESLESLAGCIEDYRNDSVLDGVEYTIICRTDRIKKTIHGYHAYQSTVRTVLDGLLNLDEGLRKALVN